MTAPPQQKFLALLARLRVLQTQLANDIRRLETMEEKLYATRLEVGEFEQDLSAALGTDVGTTWRRLPVPVRAPIRVSHFKLVPIARGGFEAHIDGRKVKLTPRLAALLLLLAGESKSLPDQGQWKSSAHVRLALALRPNVPIGRSALNNLVFRLRRALVGAGIDERLVQFHPTLGLRFYGPENVSAGALCFPEEPGT